VAISEALHQDSRPATLAAGLTVFVNVYMPARNYGARTRDEYHTDIEDLRQFLQSKGLSTWAVVGGGTKLAPTPPTEARTA
jgi:hypothetical protein